MSEHEEPGPPGSPQELFGRRLKRLRERRELTQQALGSRVPISQGRIAQFENGKEFPTEAIARRLDEILTADRELTDIWGLAGRMSYEVWSRTYGDAEAEATRIYHFANMLPGLAQTEDYARAIITGWHRLFGGLDIEESVRHRAKRQSILDGANPPWLWSILDEVALRRVVGSRDVMRAQLVHLLRLSERPRITFQVIPYESEIPGGFTSTVLSLLTLPDGQRVVYQESGLNGSFAKNPEEVASYVTFYDHLHAKALPPDDSIAFIRRVLEEQYREPDPI
ncbi:DUF5753 domain-containing protein [Streptomyces triculaminicus]|uniref:DUF5753 domain-containing protein n=1 Tax=Streptomyces triculaminicus TaxID=2816232 RepID=UPI003789AFE2